MAKLKFKCGRDVTIYDIEIMKLDYKLSDSPDAHLAFDAEIEIAGIDNPVGYFAGIAYVPYPEPPLSKEIRNGAITTRMYKEDGKYIASSVVSLDDFEYHANEVFNSASEIFQYAVKNVFKNGLLAKARTTVFLIDESLSGYPQQRYALSGQLPKQGKPVIANCSSEHIVAAVLVSNAVEVFVLRHEKPSIRMIMSFDEYDTWMLELKSLRSERC
jgi:hypothetical protein